MVSHSRGEWILIAAMTSYFWSENDADSREKSECPSQPAGGQRLHGERNTRHKVLVFFFSVLTCDITAHQRYIVGNATKDDAITTTMLLEIRPEDFLDGRVGISSSIHSVTMGYRTLGSCFYSYFFSCYTAATSISRCICTFTARRIHVFICCIFHDDIEYTIFPKIRVVSRNLIDKFIFNIIKTDLV